MTADRLSRLWVEVEEAADLEDQFDRDRDPLAPSRVLPDWKLTTPGALAG